MMNATAIMAPYPTILRKVNLNTDALFFGLLELCTRKPLRLPGLVPWHKYIETAFVILIPSS